MARSVWVVASIIAVAVVGSAQSALACSCRVVGPVCQAYWKTDAVFDATVVDIELRSSANAESLLSDTTVTLNVHQSWKGAAVGSLEVTTSRFEGPCGYAFKKGHRYLVFARRGPGGSLEVSECSATREYDGRGPVAEFLASLARPARGGRVFGTVSMSNWSLETGTRRADQPATARVRLFGAGQEIAAVSANGQYEFTGVPIGRYLVEPAVPDGYTTFEPTRDIEIPDPHACAEENFRFAPGGRILGTLLDSGGRRVAGLPVELVSADALSNNAGEVPSASAYTDSEGNFEFSGLPAGRYALVINLRNTQSPRIRYPRTFYSSTGSDPQTLLLSLGQALDIGTWRLPLPREAMAAQGRRSVLAMRRGCCPASDLERRDSAGDKSGPQAVASSSPRFRP